MKQESTALNELLDQELTVDPSPFKFKSPSTGRLGLALSKAQSEIKNAAKDKDNPFFKSMYADLASVWDACREPLTKNGLSVTQPLSYDDKGRVILTTLLLHASGEWIASQIPVIPTKNDPQSMGSAITYYRRFSLSAIVGVAPSEKPSDEDADDSDDDGNAASGRVTPQETKKPPVKPRPQPPQEKSNTGHPQASKPQSIKAVSLTQALLDQALSLAKEKQVHNSEISAYIKSTFGVESSKDLTQPQFETLIAWLASKETELPEWEKQMLAMDGMVK